MPKVVINDCFGGFGLSYAATMEYAKRKGIELFPVVDEISLKHYGPLEGNESDYRGVIHYYKVSPEQYEKCSEKWHREDGNYKRINAMGWYFTERDIARDDSDLVAIVEEMQSAASSQMGKLAIVEVPEDAEWEIEEYDGWEHVAEKHRTWHAA